MGRSLHAIQLTRPHGTRLVVKGIDILVEPGEIVALLGRNGAGKSTTFQMIAGQTTPDSGDILLDETFAGMDPIHVSEVQDLILRLRSHGLGVLISDHNVYYAFEIIDRGCVIDDGGVIVAERAARLATSPLARSAFLGADFRVPPLTGADATRTRPDRPEPRG